jgi:ABC-2 type transport system ATP-binding protein
MALTKNIRKQFKDNSALSGADLEMAEGEVLMLLGPNSARKTTLARVLTTLLRPDSGYARINGWDVTKDPEKVRASRGMAGLRI